MATRNWDVRFGANRFTALNDFSDDVERQFVYRHADQRQRHDRCAAHGVHVGNRIGRGNPAEVIRVIDNRHEEVRGRDQRLLVIEFINSGVIGGFDADH